MRLETVVAFLVGVALGAGATVALAGVAGRLATRAMEWLQ